MKFGALWAPILKLIMIIFQTSGAISLEEAHWAHMGFSIVNRALSTTLAIIVAVLKIQNTYIQIVFGLLLNLIMMYCIAFMIHEGGGERDDSSYMEFIEDLAGNIIGNWVFCGGGLAILFIYISRVIQISE